MVLALTDRAQTEQMQSDKRKCKALVLPSRSDVNRCVCVCVRVCVKDLHLLVLPLGNEGVRLREY